MYSGFTQIKYFRCVCLRLCVWAWAQWGRKGASSLWGRSMCPASTAVVLGHRCHLLQQPASHHSPSPHHLPTCKQHCTGGQEQAAHSAVTYLDCKLLFSLKYLIQPRVTELSQVSATVAWIKREMLSRAAGYVMLPRPCQVLTLRVQLN